MNLSQYLEFSILTTWPFCSATFCSALFSRSSPFLLSLNFWLSQFSKYPNCIINCISSLILSEVYWPKKNWSVSSSLHSLKYLSKSSLMPVIFTFLSIIKYKRIIAHRFAMCQLLVIRGLLTCFGCGKGRAARQCATPHLRVGLPRGALGLRSSASRGNPVGLSGGMTHNVSSI